MMTDARMITILFRLLKKFFNVIMILFLTSHLLNVIGFKLFSKHSMDHFYQIYCYVLAQLLNLIEIFVIVNIVDFQTTISYILYIIDLRR